MYISLYTDMYPVAWHFHMETHFASLAERQYHNKAQNLITAFDLDELQKLLWIDYYGCYPQLHEKALPKWTNNEPLKVRLSLLISTTSILIILNWERKHCAKSVQIRSFFGSEYRKIWTRKNSVFGHLTQWKARETRNFLCKSSFIWLCVFSSHIKLWYLKVLNARNLSCALTITTHTYLISYLSQLRFFHFPKRYKFTLWCSVQ